MTITDSAAGRTSPELWTPDDEPTYIVDWDSTLCEEETLDFLAAFVLDTRELARFRELTDQGMVGGMPFSDSLTQRFALLRATREQVDDAGEQLVARLDPTATARRNRIERIAHRIHVISGGFEELITPSLSRLGLDPENVHANRFVYDQAGYVVGADPERLTSHDDGKAAQAAALGLQGLRVAIGDGYNDYRIKDLGHADLFVAYVRHQEREAVVPHADMVAASFGEPLLFS